MAIINDISSVAQTAGGDISQLLSVVGHILFCNGATSPKLLIIRRHANTEALLDRTFLYDRKYHTAFIDCAVRLKVQSI